MKIATLNIDWASKYKSVNHYLKIEHLLNKEAFDVLVLTESIDLQLNNHSYKTFSEKLPENIEYEKLNYTSFLRNEIAYRITIYTSIKPKNVLDVVDKKTSLALELDTKFGEIIIYATIIGTKFRENPFAKNELENCKTDCRNLVLRNKSLFVVGDLNTSFNNDEKSYSINKATTKSLNNLFAELNLINATATVKQNIDHIIIPNYMDEYLIECGIFVNKNIVSDHQGVFINLK